mgnify:CR=1 FL=1
MTEKPENNSKGRNRISDEMHECIEIMATKGLSVHAAADLANIHRDTAVRNLRKPKVIALLNQKIKDIRENAAQAAFMRNVDLAQNSKSEHVRLQTNKWLAAVGGVAPIHNFDRQFNHTFGRSDFDFEYTPEPKADPNL